MAELRAARLARARQAEDQFHRRWLTDQYHELRRKTAEFDAKLIADVDNLTTGNAFLDYVLKAAIFRPIVVGFSMTSGGDPGRALASAKEWDGLPVFSTLHHIGNVSEEGLTWGNGLGLVTSLTDVVPGVGAADNVAMGGIKIALNHGDEVVDASKIAIRSGKELLEEGGEQLAQRGDDLFVGTYNQVRNGNISSGLNSTHTPHHVVQDAVSETSRGRGITINIRKDLHAETRTYRKPVEPGLTMRQHLARDIKDLRKILGEAGYERTFVNRQLEELIRQNKSLGGFGK